MDPALSGLQRAGEVGGSRGWRVVWGDGQGRAVGREGGKGGEWRQRAVHFWITFKGASVPMEGPDSSAEREGETRGL